MADYDSRMSAVPERAPLLERLPSGRHRLTREDVSASQRGRLLEAMVQVVAEKGYPATTVADVVDRAQVSRRTFYEQFEDKESCFLAAYDVGVEYVLGRIRSASEASGSRGWRERVRSDLRTYLETLAAEPAFAAALHVETLRAGPAALERRAEIFEIFTERTRRAYELAREEDSSRPRLPLEVFRIHTGGLDELIRDHLRERGAETLPELVDPATRATLAMFGEPRSV